MMLCPICLRTQFTQTSGDTHYVCVKKDGLPKEETGCGTQFTHEVDKKINYPHAIIFARRAITNFFKYDYLNIKPSNLVED